jgi:hypothetical protein
VAVKRLKPPMQVAEVQDRAPHPLSYLSRRRLVEQLKIDRHAGYLASVAMTQIGIRALVRHHGAWGKYPTKKKTDKDAMLQSGPLPGSQLGRTVFQQVKHCRRVANAQARGQLARIHPACVHTPRAARNESTS